MPAHAHVTDPDAASAPGEAATDPLGRERAHLAASRSALRAMREDVENLDIRDVTANWVNAVVLQAQIDDRIKALADLSHTPSSSAASTTCTRPARSSPRARRASSSTSAAATSTTPAAIRW